MTYDLANPEEAMLELVARYKARLNLALADCTALKLELDAEKFNHHKDNKHLIEERDALKDKIDELEMIAGDLEEERDALRAALEELARVEGGMAVHGNETVRIARQALAQLEEK